MIIRPLEATDDLAALTRLLHSAYARLGEDGLNYTAVDQPVAVTRARIDRGKCFVAVNDGSMVGTVTYYPLGRSSGCSWYEQADVSTLGQLAVLPYYQGYGIGLLLLQTAERQAREEFANELALDTAEPANHLVSWYLRLGFRLVEHVQWTGKTYSSVILSKDLRPG